MLYQEPLVSVIIPVYKVEKYIRRCIESVLCQTYQNFEVILVDDGSPDQCGRICDEYADAFAKVRVIHQTNQGLSAARNNAVPASGGAYITFIDSDDYVTEDYLEYLVSLIQKYHADISIGGSIYQYEEQETRTPKKETFSCLYKVEMALSRMNYGQGFGLTAWGKLYKRELVEKYPYPVGKIYEDIATTYKIIGDSAGAAFGNQQIYYWQQRSGSTMHSGFNIRQLDGITAARSQLDYFYERYPSAVPAGKYRYTAKAVELTDILFTSDGDHSIFEELRGYMNEYASDVLMDTNAKRSIKVRISAMKMGYYPAKLVFAVHRFAKKIIM